MISPLLKKRSGSLRRLSKLQIETPLPLLGEGIMEKGRMTPHKFRSFRPVGDNKQGRRRFIRL
jgi:hypothetical protein